MAGEHPGGKHHHTALPADRPADEVRAREDEQRSHGPPGDALEPLLLRIVAAAGVDVVQGEPAVGLELLQQSPYVLLTVGSATPTLDLRRGEAIDQEQAG